MQTEFEYLVFTQVQTTGKKTTTWECRNKKSQVVLGLVKWYGPWQQYCYFPVVQAVYSKGCLQDIAHFIGQLRR